MDLSKLKIKALVGSLILAVTILSGCSLMNRGQTDTHREIKNQSINEENVPGADSKAKNALKAKLAWEKERKFMAICRKHGTYVRMAAFRTVLPNPLPGEESNVRRAADLLRGTVVGPGKLFSLNMVIGPYNRENGYLEGPTYLGNEVKKTIGGGVCKIASTLYNVIVLANLKVVERHPHGMQVPYVPPGQDATVSDSLKDFKFKNNTDIPVLIWSQTRGNILEIAVYGGIKPPVVIWKHRILKRKAAKTMYRTNQLLRPNQTRVVIPGADGLVVRTWLLIKYANGRTEIKNLGVDKYQPLPEVIEKG